jgi:transposase InsO family protein
MARKRYSDEECLRILRQVEVELAAGADVATSCRSAGISDATLRREILNAEWFATTRQAQTVINQRLRQYNHVRPHHALGMRPPVPETILVNHQITGTEQGG